MNDDRIHAFLDGELTREALSEDELAGAAELQRHIDAAAGFVRSAPVPDFAARVLERLPTRLPAKPARPTWGSAVLAWLWRSHPVTLEWRPAYAMVGALAVALLLVFGAPVGETASPVPLAGPTAEEQQTIYVQFRLDAPDASSVELAGSFTNWTPAHELQRTAPGVWTVVIPLDPGVHDYTFVVDGERWIVDPHAPSVADDFGGANSRLFLPSPVHGV